MGLSHFVKDREALDDSTAGWWFGTFFIFPNSWDDDPI